MEEDMRDAAGSWDFIDLEADLWPDADVRGVARIEAYRVNYHASLAVIKHQRSSTRWQRSVRVWRSLAFC